MGGRRKSSVAEAYENKAETTKKLKSQIAQCKGTLTRAESFLHTQKVGPVDKDAIALRLKQLEEVLEASSELTLNLRVINDECSEEDFLEDEIEERCLRIMSELRRIDKKTPGDAASTYSSVKLPEIDIPAYDGKDVAKFQTFSELFSAVIHNNIRLEPIQKLFYLRKFLKGEPLALIESLPLTGDSYVKSLELLKNRYDNKFIIITNHVQALLDLPSSVKGTASSLRELVSKARQNLGALKSLGQPTEQWDMIMLPMLLRKIDQFSCRVYHNERDQTKLPKLEDFFAFIEKRASSFEESQRTEGKSSFTNFNKNKVSNLVSKSSILCRLCNSPEHKLFKCTKFEALSPQERNQFATKNNLCPICLNMHTKKCQFHFKCAQCNSKQHNTLLHCDTSDSKASLHSNDQSSTILLPTIKAKIAGINKKSHLVARGLVDSGSQVSFIKSDLVKLLKLKPFKNNLTITALGQHAQKAVQSVNVNFMSLHNDYRCQVTCSIVDQITTKLPQHKINIENVPMPVSVVLADDQFYKPGDISFLLSADVFFKIMLPGKIKLQDSNLYLLNTEFGSILSGEVQKNILSLNSNFITMHTVTSANENNVDHLLTKFWETELVPEIKSEVTAEQDPCEADFERSVQLINGKFQVSLPLQKPVDQLNLGNTFPIAAKTLESMEKRLARDKQLNIQYSAFINEYIKLGHAKVIPLCYSEIKNRYFMQHLPVIRQDRKTNKVRVVFNGNTRASSRHCSLNDVLLNGPKTQRDLFDILVQFRSHEYVLIADIRHMYRAINIQPSHRHLQNILWKDDNNKRIILELQTVTYGLKSSSFLATRCLKELAERYHEEFPLAAEVLRSSTYIDDALFGGPTIEKTIEVRDQLISLLHRANFQLHKWAANSPFLLTDIDISKHHFAEHELCNENLSIKALGLSYEVAKDIIKISGPIKNVESWDKRSILSFISSFYDPLGLAAPITMKAKEFLQKLWKENLQWDSPIPVALTVSWEQFYNELASMPTICINRNIKTTNADSIELLGYCDGSNIGYGCSLYVKTSHENKVTITLLSAKSRIAPIKQKLTIPKLELNAALLLAKLYHRINSVYTNIKFNKKYMFTDSQIVLCWINSKKSLSAYVKNRVHDIQLLTQDCQWFHIDGANNPADCLSRGCNPHELITNTLWWNGPPQISLLNYTPEASITCNHLLCSEGSDSDKRPACLNVIIEVPKLLLKYSLWSKTLRVMAWIFRFAHNCKNKSNKYSGCLSVTELKRAEYKIISVIQHIYFASEINSLESSTPIKSCLKSLNPFVDENNVLRVNGRLQNASIPYSQKYPIILPKKCHVTDLLINNEHIALLHAGQKLVSCSLSLKYWIINCNREVKKIIHKCVKCYRFKADVTSQLMGPLPSSRVTEAQVFSVVGIDYCGPFQIRQSTLRRTVSSKGYVAVFVCFTTKAVHMELVSDMTTQCFIAALKRFIARRGLPTTIHCDNAKTFKGAQNTLNELYYLKSSSQHRAEVTNFATSKGIECNFIPSWSPTFGGIWESAVKSAKFHFKRIIGNNMLTYEEFNTIIICVEGILNSRPLTQLSRDPSDFSFLSPSHFLIGRPMNAIPEPDIASVPTNRLRFWRRCTQIQQQFWNVWHKQYLSQLNSRPKWYNKLPDLKKGQLVLIKKENSPPLQWPMARIIQVYPGQDGKVRVADIRTPSGQTRMSINKICIMPID